MEEKKPKNPSAFPFYYGDENGESGMTLRDYFAAKCMQSIIVESSKEASWNHSYDNIAAMAYLQADAMLKERETNKNK